MRLLVPDGARRQRLLQCEARAPSPAPPSPSPSTSLARTVVVGIRRDAASRELLTWALVKVANAGDRVVALHVATADADGTALLLLLPSWSRFVSRALIHPSLPGAVGAFLLLRLGWVGFACLCGWMDC
jgi:hypothetical protein